MKNHDEELLAELLLQWEELYERGQDSSPQELCRDCPHLIEELGKRIAAMKATNWLNNPDCPAESPTAPTSQSAGKVLSGRYRLDDLIATGGFAEVWRAFDTELQRIVAIKLPKPNRLASATNFITEARRVARLKHPGIVPVFDVGTEGTNCFIVSEYVEGGSLGDRLTKSPPSPKETSRWLSEIAAALEYAHLHGVIHRDIKPANILIDHHGRALLADFGIAQSAQKTGTFAPSLGTLRYMSPEQLEGKAATPQSDVYSLGVVLHECLTGRLPYSSNEPAELRRQILGGMNHLNTTVPVPLLEVCRKAMKRLPHERHASAAHFATDLERVVHKAFPRRTWWKSPLLMAVLAAVPLIVAITVGAIGVGLPKATPVTSEQLVKPLNPASTHSTNSGSTANVPSEPAVEVTSLPVRVNSIGMKLIEMPAGSFYMGSDHGNRDERPVHKTMITRPFFIGQTEVTQEQWLKVMGTPRWKEREYRHEGRNHAATCIDWFEAVEFCNKLSEMDRAAGKLGGHEEYALPTEAQWEYACRAGTAASYSYGEDSKLLDYFAWWGAIWGDGNAKNEPFPHDVATKKPNPWGLYDMHGNVYEWCSDWYGADYYGKSSLEDPQGPETGMFRVLRGGGWITDAHFCRSTIRFPDNPPEHRHQHIGFRVVITPAGPDGEQIVYNSVGMALVRIRAGEFLMGSETGRPDEQPRQTVTLTKDYFLGRTEVTNRQWKLVMGHVPPEWGDVDLPARWLSWEEAVEFCRKLSSLPAEQKAGRSYRLPTEAEWEYACRAGSQTAYSFGDDTTELTAFAYMANNSGKDPLDTDALAKHSPDIFLKVIDGNRCSTHPVGMLKLNAWGLFDMHGNVWEWCGDWHEPYPRPETIDPTGPAEGSGRVFRGGSWRCHAEYCRTAFRGSLDPTYRLDDLGLRVVMFPATPDLSAGQGDLNLPHPVAAVPRSADSSVSPSGSPVSAERPESLSASRPMTTAEIRQHPFADVLVIADSGLTVAPLKETARVCEGDALDTFGRLPSDLVNLDYSLLPKSGNAGVGILFSTAGRAVIGTDWHQRNGFLEQKWTAYLAKQAVQRSLMCGGLTLWDVVAKAGDTVLIPSSCVVMSSSIDTTQQVEAHLAKPVPVPSPCAEVLIDSARLMPLGIVGDPAFNVRGQVPEDLDGLQYAVHGTNGPLPASEMALVITFKTAGRIAYLSAWRGGMPELTALDDCSMRFVGFRRENERLGDFDIWDIVGKPGERVVVPEWGKVLAKDIEVRVMK